MPDDTEKKWQGVGLLLVDIQNDFMSGSLAIKDADSILPTVKRLIHDYPFQTIISSQDYHPPSHISFASHHNTEPFQSKKLPHPITWKAAAGETIEQMMWPDHCVKGTQGCAFHAEIVEALEIELAKGTQCLIVQKGQDPNVDGYSAFSLNNYVGFSELPKLLFSQQTPIHTLVVVGLASDYCVLSSAVDAAKFQLRTIVVQDGVRGVNEESTAKAYDEMKSWGIEIVQTDADLLKILK